MCLSRACLANKIAFCAKVAQKEAFARTELEQTIAALVDLGVDLSRITSCQILPLVSFIGGMCVSFIDIAIVVACCWSS